MKRFFPILLGLLLALTACPQAGQILGPSNAGVTPVKDGSVDSASTETPPPDVTSSPTPPDQTAAAGTPIEPKSDTHSIDDNGDDDSSIAQLRYGTDFKTVLTSGSSDAVPVSKTEIHFPAVAESRPTPEDAWKESDGCYVRMLYRPSEASAPLQYCDAAVGVDVSAEEGGNVLFAGVSAGLGTLEFYHLMPDCKDTYDKLKITTGFLGSHDSDNDAISLCSSGWQPLHSESGLKFFWIYMGSLKSVAQVRTISNPQPLSDPGPAARPIGPHIVITKP
ncbi:MAG TPA: hypothetical protein VFX30_11560 [bacterium]|nr:hypothetical protein [bacterium]